MLEAKGSLELRLVDGAEPLAGVAVRIETTGGVTLSDTKQTDAQGGIRFEALGEGSYHLACRRADCWPVVVDRALGRAEHAHVEVQMRELADVDLSVLALNGLPVTGVPVGVRSSEFGVPIDAWLEAQQIRAPSGLTTDVHGKIHLEGLPRGEYGWSVDVDGQLVSGSFELKPGKANEAAIHLPQ